MRIRAQTPSTRTAHGAIRRRSLLLASAAAAATALPMVGRAQAFPTRPLSLIVPFPAGAATDIGARAIAQELSKLLGQPVTVDNRGGAGGNIGGEAAARSAPDGHTLFMSTNNIHAMNPLLYARMSFDPNRDLVPVGPLLSTQLVLVTHPSVKANTVQELITLAKASPGRITMASAGSGTINHLAGEMFKMRTGTNLLHIPYKGGAPALNDLVGGQVQTMISSVPLAAQQIRAGMIRPLATTGTKRAESLPNVPTMMESGVPDYEAVVWFGLMVPAGTRPEIIQQLNSAMVRGAATPEFRERASAAGFELIPGPAERLAEMIRSDIERWGPVIKTSGAKLE
jgi:tripartite-type tricarboxylate transporter receptor subunit TctC